MRALDPRTREKGVWARVDLSHDLPARGSKSDQEQRVGNPHFAFQIKYLANVWRCQHAAQHISSVSRCMLGSTCPSRKPTTPSGLGCPFGTSPFFLRRPRRVRWVFQTQPSFFTNMKYKIKILEE